MEDGRCHDERKGKEGNYDAARAGAASLPDVFVHEFAVKLGAQRVVDKMLPLALVLGAVLKHDVVVPPAPRRKTLKRPALKQPRQPAAAVAHLRLMLKSTLPPISGLLCMIDVCACVVNPRR